MSSIVTQSNNNNNRIPNKFKIMEGQTDEERRELRKSFRHVHSTIESKQDELEDANSSVLDEIRGDNNALFAKVRFPRESVLDSVNVDALATRAARQVDRLVEVPRYDPIKLTTNLRQKLRAPGRGFDWKTLSSHVGVCFNAVPANVTFYAGPLDSDYTPKERTRAVRRARVVEDEEAEEIRPESIKNQVKSGETLSAVEENIRIVDATLKRKCMEQQQQASSSGEKKKRRSNTICAINYLFNPKSFTQTVENIFHFSFLLKKGDARISMRTQEEEKTPVVEPIENNNGPTPPRQAIMSLSMRDWRNLVEVYNVTGESGVPHREI